MNRKQFRRDEIAFVEKNNMRASSYILWQILRQGQMQVSQRIIWLEKEAEMALIKNEIPILEYDTEKQAVLMPNERWNYEFTEKAVMLFMGPEINEYVMNHECELVGKFESVTKTSQVYNTVHKGVEVTFCQAPLGGTGAVQIM